MQPAIQLTFATREDFEAFIVRECALRAAAPRLTIDPNLAAVLKGTSDALLEHHSRLERLERQYTKVVETNQGLHQRVDAIETDTLVTDWDGAPAGTREQVA